MKNTYIIGEIGQNHNGSVDLAKLIIELIYDLYMRMFLVWISCQ